MHTFYASPDGSGTECSLASPGSISSVREKVRSLNNSMTGDIIVSLRGGLYQLDHTVTFDAADGGTNGFNVVYQSFPGEQALLSGGTQIAGWTLHDPAKNIYKADVGSLAFRQIYINGNRAIRSRTPNLVDEKTFGPYHTALSQNPYTVNSSEIANWDNLNMVEFVWPSHWLHKRARLQSFTTNGAASTLSFMSPENNLTTLRDAFNQTNRPYYYWENAYEFLDSAGEWYAGNGTLYYIPRSGEDLSTVEVIVPKLVNLIRATGVSNLKIKGLAFKHSNWTDPSISGYLNWQSGLLNWPSNQDIPGMVHFRNSSNATIEGCVFENSGAHGLLLNGTVENILVSRNQFRSMASGAIYVVSDVCSDLTITDNLIDGTGRAYHDACGILVTCPRNSVIAHNEVRHTTYTGISIGWRWNPIDYGFNNNEIHHNLVHNFMEIQDDGGGIYTLGRMDNTTFRDNYIYGAKQSPYSGGWGIQAVYLDEGSTNKVVVDNVLADIGGFSITTKGQNNQIRHNHYNLASAPSGSGIPTGNVQVNGENWSPAARSIMDAAGIRYAGNPQLTSTSWSGTGGGNWSSGANWAADTHSNGMNQTATFSLANGGTIHQDFLGFVLGHMDFQNGNYSISGYPILLQASAPPTLTVGPGLTATIASELRGSGGFAKLGGGKLELHADTPLTGDTTVNAGTLALHGRYRSGTHTISAGAVMEFVVASGTTDFSSTTFSGAGSLRKTGGGTAIWGASSAVFNLSTGSLIDVQDGSFIAGSHGNENWSTNLADLHVASGASFHGVEANIRVNALSGSGSISSGHPSTGYQNLTLGVNGGSGTYTGTIADGTAPANLVKEGTGTQALVGSNNHTGTTTVNDGKLILSGSLTSTLSLTIATGATLEISGSLAATGNIVNNGTLILTGTPQLGAGGTITNNGTILNRSTTYTLPANVVNLGTLHTLPAATTGLAASPSDTQVTLSWNAVGGATNYIVKQAELSGGPYTIVATPNTPGQRLTDLTKGATYFFMVSANNPAGEGANSAELAATMVLRAQAADYYIDPAGNDSNNGTSEATAWKSLAKVNATTFQPGDRIRFKKGGTWYGSLWPKGSGDSTAQITLETYGTGAKPLIDAQGAETAVIKLSDQEYWTIDGFEVTNWATSKGMRFGIRVEAGDGQVKNRIRVLNNTVRDIYGIMGMPESDNTTGYWVGGIYFQIYEPGKADDVLIEGNDVRNIIGEAISFWGEGENSGGGMNYANCSPNVVVRGNTVWRTSGDGILLYGTDNELVEYNHVGHVSELQTQAVNTAAAWPTRHIGGLWQYNHVHHTRRKGNDGTAFDNDGFTSGTTIFQHNVSHDNEGGFIMEYTWGGDVSAKTIARYNISWNDSRIVASNRGGMELYNNVFYSPGATLGVEWTGTGTRVNFRNNLFVAAARTADFGSQNFFNNTFSGGITRPANTNNNANRDPLFMNPNTTGNLAGFILQAGSPERATGQIISSNGGKDFWGATLPATAPHRGASQINASGNYTTTPTFLTASGPFSATLPTSGTVTLAFSALLRDQNFRLISPSAVTWSLSPSATGYAIDSNGVVTISSTAQPQRIAVIATSGSLTSSTSFGTAYQTSDWNNAATTGKWNANDANWRGGTWSDGSLAVFSHTANPQTINLEGARTAQTVRVGNGGNNANYTFTTAPWSSLTTTSFILQGTASNDVNSTPHTILDNASITVTGDLGIGRARLSISGSSVIQAGTIGGGGIAASADWGYLTLSGNANVTATNGILGNTTAWGINLNGGTLTTAAINASDLTNLGAYLHFNGTTVRANQSNPTFVTLSNGSRAYIGAGGANIDTNGHDIGIGVSLTNASSATPATNGGTTLSGTGSLNKTGLGTLVLTQSNSYGTTTITSGTLQIGNGSTTGTLGSGAVANNAALTFNRSNDLTVSNIMSGTGTVTQIGSGTLTLRQGPSATGDLTVATGRLSISGPDWPIHNDLHISNGTLEVAGWGGKPIQTGKTITFDAPGGGTLTIGTGANFYPVNWGGQQSIISSGGARNQINGHGFNPNGNTLNFNVARGTDPVSDLRIVSSFSNGGSLTKTGNGILELTAGSNLTGTTIISAGTLLISEEGRLSSGSMTNNAALIFNRSTDLTVSNLISGTGSVTQAGLGIITLTRINSYSGNTTVQAGTLRLGNGTSPTNLANSADVTVAAGAMLHLDYSGTDQIRSLWVDGLQMPIGIYTSTSGFIIGPGTITVTTGPASANYATWSGRGIHNLTSSPAADDDNDGIANILEYALGGNPRAASSNLLPTATTSAGNLVFTFRRTSSTTADTTQVFQHSTNLTTWTDIPLTTTATTVAIQPNTPQPGTEIISITFPPSTDKTPERFGRLKVTR